MTRNLLTKFGKSTDGNLAIMGAVLTVPLLLAAGVSVDYSMSTLTRSNMQNALDVATMSVISMPKATTLAARGVKLQDIYVANGGSGTATINTFNVDAIGAADISTSAQFSQPTTFMRLGGKNNVVLGVKSESEKAPALIEAKFEIVKSSGWWDKTMSLYGIKYGEATAKRLLQITYVYNRSGDSKGYGTMVVSTVATNASGVETLTTMQTQVCTTVNVNNFNNLPAGAITGYAGSQRKVTTCTSTGGAATVDVSDMDTLYLQMDVPKSSSTYPSNPGTAIRLRSDDPATSNRLYIGGVEVETNKVVNIFTAVPCGDMSEQAWEDGGNAVPAPVSNADFFYKVTGKCDFSSRRTGIALTK